jgi:hypothetical protein
MQEFVILIVKLKFFNLINQLNLINLSNEVSTLSSTPNIVLFTGFTGRGEQSIPILNPTAQDLRTLSQTLDFKCEMIVGTNQSARDTNRISIMGHSALTASELFSTEPFDLNGTVLFAEGSPRLELLQFAAMYLDGIQIGNVPFSFYESLRGKQFYCPIASVQLTGLRSTSKTFQPKEDPKN